MVLLVPPYMSRLTDPERSVTECQTVPVWVEMTGLLTAVPLADGEDVVDVYRGCPYTGIKLPIRTRAVVKEHNRYLAVFLEFPNVLVSTICWY